MGSVQSEIKCPNCDFDYCFSDYYYKSDEMYLMCGRCGYFYSRTVKFDVEKTKRIFGLVEEAYKDKEFRKAFDLTEHHFTRYCDGKESTDKDLTEEECEKEVVWWLKWIKDKEFNHWYLLDDSGKVVFVEEEKKPLGAFRVKGKDCVATSCGCYDDEENLLSDFKDSLDSLDECKYTKLVDGVWMTVDVLANEVYPFKSQYEEEVEKRE